jgi:hypothetical protein
METYKGAMAKLKTCLLSAVNLVQQNPEANKHLLGLLGQTPTTPSTSMDAALMVATKDTEVLADEEGIATLTASIDQISKIATDGVSSAKEVSALATATMQQHREDVRQYVQDIMKGQTDIKGAVTAGNSASAAQQRIIIGNQGKMISLLEALTAKSTTAPAVPPGIGDAIASIPPGDAIASIPPVRIACTWVCGDASKILTRVYPVL